MSHLTTTTASRAPGHWLARHSEGALLRSVRSRRVATCTVVGLLLFGAALGLASLLRPLPTPCIVFLPEGEPPGDSLAGDAAVLRDCTMLKRGGYFDIKAASAERGEATAQLSARLVELQQFHPRDTVVIYVTGRSHVDAHERICLTEDDQDLARANSVPLRELLLAVRDCAAQRKLLVLDIVRCDAGSPACLSSRDVADLLPLEVASVRDPYRLTLTSCSAGQSALTSEAFRRTGFGYYFELALRGRADGWNDADEHDGRISAYELCRFVRHHVARWAAVTQGMPQTPQMLDVRGDFDLVAVSTREQRKYRQPIAELKARPYPKWLTAAWQQRDALAVTPAMHRLPRLFLEFEHDIQLAERQWRNGADPAALQRDLKSRLTVLHSRLQAAESRLDLVDPQSLAVVRRRGHQADPKIAARLDALLQQAAGATAAGPPDKAQAAIAAAADKFNQDTAKSPEIDIALAAVDALYRDASPGPEVVRLLDQVVAHRQPQPQYAETALLHRLASLGRQTPGSSWQTDQVRLALRVMRLAEEAQAAERPFVWTQAPLTEAAQRRHNGEVLLLRPGYAHLDETGAALSAAEHGLQAVLANQATLRGAYDALDEARLRLPQYGACLTYLPEHADAWSRAVRLAGEVDAALEIDVEGPPLSNKELGRRLEPVRQKAALLSTALSEINTPWTDERIGELCRAGQSMEDGASAARQMRGLLAAPWIEAQQRKKLCQAFLELEMRLHRQVMEADNAADDSVTTADLVSPSAGQDGTVSLLQQTRWAIDLLNLAGFPQGAYQALDQRWRKLAQHSLSSSSSAPRAPADVRRTNTQSAVSPQRDRQETAHRDRGEKKTEGDSKHAKDRDSLYQLAADVAGAYSQTIPRLLETSASPADQVRLAAVVPIDRSLSVLDTRGETPWTKLARQFLGRRYAWLAGHYLYVSHDLGGADFNAEAARNYLAAGGNVEFPHALLQGPDVVAQLTSQAPHYVCDLSWKRVTPVDSSPETTDSSQSPSPAEAVVYSPTSRLIATAKCEPSAGGGNISVDLQLAPAADTQSPALTEGVMVKLTCEGRDWHHRVALPVLRDGPSLQILLSADPQQPTDPCRRLRLRPAEEMQPYYLYVANPTAEDCDVVAALSGAAQTSPPVKVPAGGTAKIAFPPKPPKPGAPLPPLEDALAVRVLDAKSGRRLAAWRYPIEVVSPRQYVRLLGSQFVPHRPGVNRLSVTLQAFEMPPGPPCMIELTLPAEDIPGLMGVTSGVMRGVLPSDGTPLTLTAENLLLADGYDENGAFYLNVDGVKRAFRYLATFARWGDPTTPYEQLQPRVLIVADQYARSGPGYKVTVRVDNAADGSRLQLDLGQFRDGVFVADRTRHSDALKTPHVGFTPTGQNGALLFSVSLDDWSTEFDTTGIVGPRQLRARLIDPQGRIAQTATWRVAFDDTPPRAIAFLQAPPQVAVNQTFQVTAQAIDDVTAIAKTNFFLGKPDHGAPPQGAKLFAAKPLDAARTQWQATLPGQKEAGPVEVSVQFTDQVGQSSYLTTSIEVADQAGGAKGGGIQGSVVEGSLPQAGLEVVLADDKRNVQQTVKTDTRGQFHFAGVKPGKYIISSVKQSSQRQAQADVEVTAGQTARVELSLSL